MAYGLFGKFPTPPGKADELESILKEAADLIQHAKGCHLYLVCRDTQDTDSVGVFELWNNKEDHDQSLNYPGVKQLISRARPLIGGPPVQTVLDVVGGKGFPE